MITSIRIRRHKFSFAERFAEGHELTACEAQALNALRAENIRNNVDSWVVSRMRDGELAPEDHAELAVEIAAYAESYEFLVRARPSDKASATELAAAELAVEFALRSGASPTDLDWEIKLAEIESSVELQIAARDRARLAQTTTLEALDLGELGGI